MFNRSRKVASGWSSRLLIRSRQGQGNGSTTRLTIEPHLSPAAIASVLIERKSILVVAGRQAAGIEEVDDGICLVSFMHYDLGYID